jgi:hypothetical protein
LKDGYIAKLGTDDMKSGKLDDKISKLLKRTNNYIERD